MSQAPSHTPPKNPKPKADMEESKTEEPQINSEKLDAATIAKARKDLQTILGRKPTAAETKKFLQDMPASPIYRGNNGQALDKVEKEKQSWKSVDPEVVSKAQSTLKAVLGREPTTEEMEKFLTEMGNQEKSTGQQRLQDIDDFFTAMENGPSRTESQKEGSEWEAVDPKFVAEAQKDLKELLGREATPKEVQDFLEQMPQPLRLNKGKQTDDGWEMVNPNYVAKAQKILKAKLGREATAKELEDFLKDSPPPAKQESPSGNWKPVDQATVDDVQKDLKELLGRDPTAKEVEQFLEDMAESDAPAKENSQSGTWKKVDQTVVDDVQKDLKELLGRDPTAKEVENYLQDIGYSERDQSGNGMMDFISDQARHQGVDPETFRRPAIQDPLSDLPRNRDRPYTSTDAKLVFENIGDPNPTDQEINDWLFENNQEYIGRFDNLPGITAPYGTAQLYQGESHYFSATNVFIMLLVLMLGGLFYRSRKKKDTEDEYVKASSDKKIYEKFYNPFNRKNDKDDDFDKVL